MFKFVLFYFKNPYRTKTITILTTKPKPNTLLYNNIAIIFILIYTTKNAHNQT